MDKYKLSSQDSSRKDRWTSPSSNIDLGTYEKEYSKSLFNKGVQAKNEDDVGHVMKETDDKIVIFGHPIIDLDIEIFGC